MARKTKKKSNRMPPLSFLDHVIYWIVFFLGAVVVFGGVTGFLLLRKHLAFADQTVIAVYERAGVLWVLPSWIYLLLLLLIPWVMWYENKRPIFGIRGFQYGPPKWAKVYPLFMKNKPYEWISENAKKNRKFNRKLGALLLLVLFALTCIPLPFSIFGRETLHEDHSVSRYNAINREVAHYDAEDVQTVTFETYRYYRGRYSIVPPWSVKIVLTMSDGAKYTFHARDFSGNDMQDVRFWLLEMLRIKDSFSAEQIVVDGVKNLGLVINDQSLNEKEAELLYELFAQP